jgi:ketosteroid isomerase-like protein
VRSSSRTEGRVKPRDYVATTTEEGPALLHPNDEVVRKSYDAFARRDLPALLELLSDQITLVIPGRSIQSGTFSGKDEVRRYFALVGAHTAGSHRVEVLDVLANDARAVALVRAVGERGDEVFDMTLVHVWRFSDGMPAELSIIPSDQYAFDAFWS